MKKISRLFKNELTKNILLFFNENPNCIDTAKGISLWIGADAGAIEKALSHLVKEGILVSHTSVSTTAYAYTNNKHLVKKIEKYIKNML